MDIPVNKLPSYINEDEEIRLISSARKVRDKAIIKMMVHTGLRVSELVNIKTDSLNLEEMTIKVIGKRNKERLIPLSEETIIFLSNYLKRKPRPTEYLFSKKNGYKITRQAVWQMLKLASEMAQLEHVHPHMLRHTFCTRLVDRGVQLHKVADLAGHTKLDTTRIYTHVSSAQKKEAVSILNTHRNPLFLLLSRFKRADIKKRMPLVQRFARSVAELRRNEIRKIEDNMSLHIHTCILAPEGYGKSHVLQELKTKDKALFLRALETKQDIIDLFQQMHTKSFFPKEVEWDDLRKEITRDAIPVMLERINKNISEDYFLIIDDITTLSKKFKKVFYELTKYFTLLAATEKRHEIYLDKFDIMQLPLLSRKESILLMNSLIVTNTVSETNQIALYDLVYTRTQGFPRGIIELTERIRKNNYSLSMLSTDNYTNPSNTRSIGMLLMMILFALVVFILKFSVAGIALTALVYLSVLMVRMFLFSRRRA